MNEDHLSIVEHHGSSARANFYSWLVWALGASFFFYKYLVQVSPSVMTNDLMRAFHVNGAGLGNLSACYFYAYLMMQIPVGVLLDKFSPRLLTSLAILLCSVSTLLFSHTNSLWLACLSRGAMGFGAAFAAVSCFKAVTVWFPPKRFALVSGMCMTAAMLGAVGGEIPLSMLVKNLNWRGALDMIGYAGVILSVIYLTIIRDKPEQQIKPVGSLQMRQSFWMILQNKQAWLLSIYSGLAFAPVTVFGGLWGVPFLEEAYHFTTAQAAFSISWIFIGFAAGAPLLGWLSDFVGQRKPIMYCGTWLAIICLGFVIYIGSHQVYVLSALLFLFGFGASGFFISFAMIREVFPIVLAATVLGFMNTFDSICEAISEPVVGALLDLTWNGKMMNDVHHFSTQGYRNSLTILLLYLAIALCVLRLIDETYCKSY